METKIPEHDNVYIDYYNEKKSVYSKIYYNKEKLIFARYFYISGEILKEEIYYKIGYKIIWYEVTGRRHFIKYFYNKRQSFSPWWVNENT